MKEWLEEVLPNVLSSGKAFPDATKETLYMTFWTCLIGFSIGLALGVWLVLTMPGGLKENRKIYNVLDKLVNIFRSIPFVILMALLVGLTRKIVGTSIGTTAAIVPLVAGTIPFYARQVQNALVEVDPGVIEAARSMGLTTSEIVFRVYLREGLPAILRVSSLSIISTISLSAQAGTVGGGGLGALAITRGYNRYQTDITIVSTLVILLIVFISQWIVDKLIDRLDHS